MPSPRDKASENLEPEYNTFDLLGGGPLERAYVTQHKGGCLRTVIVAILLTAIVGVLLYIRSLGGIN